MQNEIMKNDKVYVLVDQPGFSAKWTEAQVIAVNRVTIKVELECGTRVNMNKQYRVKTVSEMKQHRVQQSIIHQGI